MIRDNLNINQLSAPATAWYIDEYLAAMDALDVERYGQFLADDAALSFNNAPPIVGKAAIMTMLTGYWSSFAGIEHDLLNIYGTDRNFVLEALNHYVRHDGKPVSVRAVAFTDRNADGLVAAVRVYADASPVFA
jgi:ketosteroid isomerase-like protein